MGEGRYRNREEMVYESLKQDILDLELKPGQLLKETELCQRFGVSRTPVRDALRMLQEQGFVLTVPYKGIYVTLLSLSNIKQMIYMRVAVETMVLRDFMKVATPMVMEDIRYLIRKQQAVIQEPDLSRSSFTVWMPRCTASGSKRQRSRSCGRFSRPSSSTIPGSVCLIL